VAEEWRVTVDLREASHSEQLLAALPAHELEDEARRRLGKRIAISGSDEQVFLYADTESAAREAQKVVGQVLADNGMPGTSRLDRWHHEEQRWEDASVPLPRTPEEERVEHERLEREETAESQATGLATWEVRIQLSSHDDARALAERLENEGLHEVVRRWSYLLVGTANEDDARELARRLQDDLPRGASIHVEPGGGVAWQLMPSNPFAVFGGLAG
jgi:hypothetical protein